ncbi:MAG: 4Fe-4S dicluster domain-containing protein [Caldisericia bacterium]|nr:4Fe-4S dicluster domain-containing protein [Caldisericia bacterium]MDD4614315.1 4Fe-4S dicluster domain-containing protein [Caldisericia bacterium]
MNVFWNQFTSENDIERITFLLHKQLEGDRQTSRLFGKRVGLLINLGSLPSELSFHPIDILLKLLSDYFAQSNLFLLSDLYSPSFDKRFKATIPDTRYMQQEHFQIVPKKRAPLQISFFGGVKKSSYLSERYISKSLAEADYLLSITCLSEDPIFTLHGSTSSYFWMLPSYTKNEVLIQENLQQRCLSLLEAMTPMLSKSHCSINIHSSQATSFMVLSQNTISADAVSCLLCGLPPAKNKLLGIADKKGFGNSVISHMTIYGDPIKKPMVEFKAIGETYSIGIHKDQCNLCEDCTDLCPLHAMYISNQHLFWDTEKCNRCGYCLSICPQSALFKRRK